MFITGITRLPGKVSPTVSKSNPTPVLNVVGAKLVNVKASVANTLPDENESFNQQEERDIPVTEEANETDDKSIALDLSMGKIQNPENSMESRRVNEKNITVSKSNKEATNLFQPKVSPNQKTYRFSLDTRCKVCSHFFHSMIYFLFTNLKYFISL